MLRSFLLRYNYTVPTKAFTRHSENIAPAFRLKSIFPVDRAWVFPHTFFRTQSMIYIPAKRPENIERSRCLIVMYKRDKRKQNAPVRPPLTALMHVCASRYKIYTIKINMQTFSFFILYTVKNSYR